MLCHRAERHNLRHGPSDGCSKVGNVIIRLNLGAIGGGNKWRGKGGHEASRLQVG
jgi:hypothetical protein